MALRLLNRVYLCTAMYAALIFVPVHGPRLLITALLQFAISACLITLMILLVSNRNEIREFLLRAFRACANLLLCLLPASPPDWFPPASPALPSDSFRSILFQRPPPSLA